MLRKTVCSALFSAALLSTALLGAMSSDSLAHAQVIAPADGLTAVSEMAPPPHDPKKKNPGDTCKSSDECQIHHSCVKEGDKSVCKAPPPRKLPPGAVT